MDGPEIWERKKVSVFFSETDLRSLESDNPFGLEMATQEFPSRFLTRTLLEDLKKSKLLAETKLLAQRCKDARQDALPFLASCDSGRLRSWEPKGAPLCHPATINHWFPFFKALLGPYFLGGVPLDCHDQRIPSQC